MSKQYLLGTALRQRHDEAVLLRLEEHIKQSHARHLQMSYENYTIKSPCLLKRIILSCLHTVLH